MQYPPLPPPRPERQMWRWYRSMHPLTQISLGCLTLLFVLFLCSFGVAITPSFVQGFMRSFQHSVVAPGTRVTPDVTSVVGYSHATIGSSLNDFIVQYGSPATPGSNVFTSNGVQIAVYVDGSVVERISVTGPATWTIHDTLTFCSQFLPDGAKESSTTGTTFIDYSSNMGQIVMQLQPPTCSLFMGPS